MLSFFIYFLFSGPPLPKQMRRAHIDMVCNSVRRAARHNVKSTGGRLDRPHHCIACLKNTKSKWKEMRAFLLVYCFSSSPTAFCVEQKERAM